MGDFLGKFDLEYCKSFTPDQLRKIYNGESVEVIDALIAKIYPAEKPKAKAKENTEK